MFLRVRKGYYRSVIRHRWAKGSQGGRSCAWRKDRLQGDSERKNARYGERKASEPLSFEGRVEGAAPHPPLKGQGEGREAYSVNFCRCVRVVRFFKYPQYYKRKK